ncbi:MAG: (Fe-S)-binding protein [Anaerolineaceae bacterium]|nr:(Fe-S)-binding protein [Anaerolineaceae bacterium]
MKKAESIKTNPRNITLNVHGLSEDAYLNCIRCGLCLSVCPTYREYLTETTSPRGRVALTRKGLEEELVLSPNLFEQMYACFACMACNDACPVGIQPAELALQMRQKQEQMQPSKWKNGLFGGLIPKPERMELATLPLRIYEMIGLRRLVYTLGIRKLMPAQLRDLESMLPHLPQRPLREILPEKTPADEKSLHQVGFFLGCAQSLMFADESAATVRVLTKNNCTVFKPKDVTCCGMPAKGYGREDLLIEMAKENIETFEKINTEVIVTDCATCGSTLKEYGELFENDPLWAERAGNFSSKVRDISEYLMEIPLKKPAGKVEGVVTYHDPCHLRRGQDVWQQPREILQMIDGLEFVEASEADWCCGSAGSQLITHYETSLKVLDRKMVNIENTQANFVASGCPGCQMQLNVGVRKNNLDTEVVHPVTLLDKAYRS